MFKTKEELQTWLQNNLHLNLPTRPLCNNHHSPLDYLWAAYHEPAHDLVVWAPRGGGKTRLGAVATLLDLLHKPQISIRILGGSLEQSLRMWEHLLPDIESVAADLIDGKLRARRFQLTNRSVAGVATQSQTSVRGLRVQKLRCDEVDLFDPRIWEAAQLVTRSLSVPGQTPIAATIEALSTCQNPGGLMESIIDRALEKPGGPRLIKWCILDVLETCPPDRPCTPALWKRNAAARPNTPTASSASTMSSA